MDVTEVAESAGCIESFTLSRMASPSPFGAIATLPSPSRPITPRLLGHSASAGHTAGQAAGGLALTNAPSLGAAAAGASFARDPTLTLPLSDAGAASLSALSAGVGLSMGGGEVRPGHPSGSSNAGLSRMNSSVTNPGGGCACGQMVVVVGV